jgi:hypothetical protein
VARRSGLAAVGGLDYDGAMVRPAVWLLFVAGCGKVAASGDAGVLPDAAAAPDAAMIDGLAAWYRMDSDTVNVISDSTGRHDGACDAGRCPSFTRNGKLGGAFVFDGVDDLFHVRSAADLEGTQGFTVTAWINHADATDGCVINKSYQGFGANSWQACIAGDTGELAFFTSADNEQDDAQISVVLGTSRWYHIALWWDGHTKATYVDGSRVAFKDNVPFAFDAGEINIGADIDTSTLVAPFRGMIDDVRIYNRALSPAELVALQTP